MIALVNVAFWLGKRYFGLGTRETESATTVA